MVPTNARFLFGAFCLIFVGYFIIQVGIKAAGAEPASRLTLNQTDSTYLPIIRGLVEGPPAPTPTATPVHTATPSPTPTQTPEANCRYGVAAGKKHFDLVSTLGAGWVLKFNTPYWISNKPANDAEKVHVIKTFQQKTETGVYLPGYTTVVPLDNQLAEYIQDNQGDLWAIGSEVERGPQPGEIEGGQGDMFPEIYAMAFHDVQAFIKANDPTARIAISGLVEVTPGRLDYLDQVWDAYMSAYGVPMPVDVWNMHIYILPEVLPNGDPNSIANVALGTDPALGKRESGWDQDACSDDDVYCFAEHDDPSIFAEQTVAMRQWMKDHGQQQKPLILSEYSILYAYIESGGSCDLKDEFGNCFTPERINNFMDATFAYLENEKNASLGYALDDNRLVQQWLWYSVNSTGPGDASNLAEADLSTLTAVGENFKDRVQNQPLSVNLLVDNVPSVTSSVGPGGTAQAQISVKFRNNGNTAVYHPFKATFYKDEARTQVINSITILPELRGCATDSDVAAVLWSGLTAGQHQFWVHVDSENVIAENPADQSDNIGTGFVQVDP